MRVCGARRLQTVVNKARSPKLWRLCGCPHMIRRGHWLKRPVAIGIMVQVSALVLILGADCVLAIMHVRRIHLEAIDHHLDELLEELVLSIGTCSPTTCRRPALLQGFLPPRVCTRAEVKEQLGSTMRSVSIPSCARCAFSTAAPLTKLPKAEAERVNAEARLSGPVQPQRRHTG